MNSTCEVLCDARDKQLLERTLCTSLHTQGTYTSPFQIVMFVHHAHGLDYGKQESFPEVSESMPCHYRCQLLKFSNLSFSQGRDSMDGEPGHHQG
jgi:hypothetical protein